MIRELVSGSGKIMISPSKSLLRPSVVWTTGFVEVGVVAAPDTLALILVVAVDPAEVFDVVFEVILLGIPFMKFY